MAGKSLLRRARFSRKNRATAPVTTTVEPLSGPAQSLTPAPTYSVVIPATDQPATLEVCLQAIYAATDAPTEVIVVDGPPGMGPAAARNAGTTRASGSILIFIDSDVAVHPDVFTRIRAAFDAEPELAAIFGSYDDQPSMHGVVSSHARGQRFRLPASIHLPRRKLTRSHAARET